MSRLRVVLDCRMAEWTGIGRYTHGLVRALAERDEVEILQVVAEKTAPPAPAAPAVVARAHPFSLGGMREMGRIVSSAERDVVHCFHFPTPSPVPHPLVVTLHDLTPLIVPTAMPSAARRAVYRAANARAVRVADAIVTPSAHTARDIERYFPKARGKTRPVLLAADDFSAGPLAQLDGPLAEKTAAPYLFSMGSTRSHKDLPTLLKAFARLAPRHPDLRLLLAGTEQPGYVEGVLGGDPVRERISFTGRITDDELRSLYAGAMAFVFPSLYEGFGLPPLEAMAFGTPVISSTAASLPEVVGDAALQIAPGDVQAFADAVERVLAEDALRQHLSSAGRARAAELTWARTADATVAVYRDVTAQR